MGRITVGWGGDHCRKGLEFLVGRGGTHCKEDRTTVGRGGITVVRGKNHCRKVWISLLEGIRITVERKRQSL